MRTFQVGYSGTLNSYITRRVRARTAYDAVKVAVGVEPLGQGTMGRDPETCRFSVRWGVDGHAWRTVNLKEISI